MPTLHGQRHDDGWWSAVRGEGPILATAIHDGTCLRPESAALMRLSSLERLREEDPHTGDIIAAVPTRVVAHRSRFEVDLNRAREQAVYRTAEEAWGLQVWKQPPTDDFVSHSLAQHDGFYDMMRGLLQGIEREHGSFVLLDVHSYNHRRSGPDGAPTPAAQAPDVNIGTFSMPPGRWDHVLQALTDTVESFDYRGRRLDIRRNVAFQGKGALARFVHTHFAHTGCAIALEVKKFFMDEWTGVPYRQDIAALQGLLAALVPALRTALARK